MNLTPQSTLRPLLAGIVCSFAFIGSSTFAATMTKDEYAAAKTRISAGEKADKKACDSLSGNTKDICEDEAEGKAKVAKAELEANYSGKPADMAKVAMVRAEADYEVAKERCDDLAGNPKDVCQQQAKTTLEKAKADAKLKQKTGAAQTEAMDTKREASLKLEVQKCDTLAGDAKSLCVANAKTKLGVN
jgi:hypothetical protein